MTVFSCQWTPYRLVSREGIPKRLLKLAGPVRDARELRLATREGELLDTEPVPPDVKDPWHFGLWVPERVDGERPLLLTLQRRDDATTIEVHPGPLPEGHPLPLRLDRTGPWLRDHLARRESLPSAADLAGFVPDMADYLHQHRIIYLRPAEHWSEGLPLGNGTMGALVTGRRGTHQRFDLDRCDLWASTPEERPIGRVHAGHLEIDYALPKAADPTQTVEYAQELRLHEAEVVTRDGALESIARVNAEIDVLEVELQWSGPQPLAVTMDLWREAMPLLEGNQHLGAFPNGSWEATSSAAQIEAAKRVVEKAPHTAPYFHEDKSGTAVIEHPLPSMTYAVAARADGTKAEWHCVSWHRQVRARAEFTLPPGTPVRLRVSIATDRDHPKPIEEARRLCAAESGDHRAWWRNFWERSFIELPDRLMENLWYLGVYHQAAFSRSCQAPGFLALWHPLDYRTWDDGYVADAQTALMWWAPFATNHLELLMPSHHTFASMLPEFLEHNPGRGALVPHHFFPEWAGGHTAFGTMNPYKGSVAWMALNFWWDYLHSRDKAFLADVAYPVIAACADFHAHDLTLGEDKRYHCSDSGAPEQNDTEDDNAYDHACITAALRAAIAAASILGVDEERAERWKEVLDNLFKCPGDNEYLWETKVNHHPYRCHPVVLFGVHPTGSMEPGDPRWHKADRTYDRLTNLFAFHYQDRHRTIPGHEGGVEPNGHAAAFMLHSAARLRGWNEVRRLFHAIVVRTQLKRNGLRGICDPRQSADLCNMAISEATSGQTSGITEALVQNYSDHVRVFPNMPSSGVFRFSGLRAFGGFLLAGECLDGNVTSITIHSLLGGALRLMNPWPGRTPTVEPAAGIAVTRLKDGSEALEITLEAETTCVLSSPDERGPDSPEPFMEKRNLPRSILCGDWDDFDPPVTYYPEDLPFGQVTTGNRVFLGMPAVEPEPAEAPAWRRIRDLADNPRWQARQTAARWCGRLNTPEATELLSALARDDQTPVVRHTAGVSLVAQKTPAALGAALRIARQTERAHLRREILKAVSRLANTDEGARLLVACFGDLDFLEEVGH